METNQQPLVLTILDTSGIQPYIFGTNNLRQSLAASELVRWATQGAARAALFEIFERDSVNVDEQGAYLERYLAFPPEGKEVTPGMQAEWLNAGGGNSLLLFRNRDLAKQFTRVLSTTLFEKAVGVNLVVAHEDIRPGDSLAAKVDTVIKAVNRKKRNRGYSAPLLGLGVTATCQFTGLPATTEYPDEDNRRNLIRISEEIACKRAWVSKAEDRLRTMLSHEMGKKYELLLDFDQLGVKGEASYMGVVHIDGNGMGKRVKQIADDHADALQNREYINGLRAFSASIEQASETALKQSVLLLAAKIEDMNSDPDRSGALRREKGKIVLPFRPIVYGGDDITFVCDGRFALSLAQQYMQALEGEKLADGTPLFVRGGVAVVKSHYPFARAYEMAEELAKSAKQLIVEHKPEKLDYAPYSAMDWHFATTGLVLGLSDIRRREYTSARPTPHPEGDLVMRPVLIHPYKGVDEWRRWDNFVELVDQFNDPDGPWAGKRNKIKGLREVLRQGPDATRRFIASLGPNHQLRELDHPSQFSETGWIGERCAWSDAVESLDLFEPLADQPSVPIPVENGGGQ